jgi:hypothetical protein
MLRTRAKIPATQAGRELSDVKLTLLRLARADSLNFVVIPSKARNLLPVASRNCRSLYSNCFFTPPELAAPEENPARSL